MTVVYWYNIGKADALEGKLPRQDVLDSERGQNAEAQYVSGYNYGTEIRMMNASSKAAR